MWPLGGGASPISDGAGGAAPKSAPLRLRQCVFFSVQIQKQTRGMALTLVDAVAVFVAVVIVLGCLVAAYFALAHYIKGEAALENKPGVALTSESLPAPSLASPLPVLAHASPLPAPAHASPLPVLAHASPLPAQAHTVDPSSQRVFVSAAELVGVLPDAIDVTIESDDPELTKFSGTYYYSFSVGFGDPRISSWSWTLDSVAAPGGNGYRGVTRAQLEYSNDDGRWGLSLNTGDPYPEPPVLLRATTGELDRWSSVWSANWTRVEPLSTIDSKRPLAMPRIKVSARGAGVISRWV